MLVEIGSQKSQWLCINLSRQVVDCGCPNFISVKLAQLDGVCLEEWQVDSLSGRSHTSNGEIIYINVAQTKFKQGLSAEVPLFDNWEKNMVKHLTNNICYTRRSFFQPLSLFLLAFHPIFSNDLWVWCRTLPWIIKLECIKRRGSILIKNLVNINGV